MQFTKKYFFPLVDPTKRARSHNDDVNHERPLILDPGGVNDPRSSHICFRHEIAKGITKAGRMTVDIIDLNRSALIEERMRGSEGVGVRSWLGRN